MLNTLKNTFTKGARTILAASLFKNKSDKPFHFNNVVITKIYIYFVADDRLANVSITIGDSNSQFANPPASLVCSYILGQPSGDIFEMFCDTIMLGRYVRLTAVNANDKLNLYEIEVYGWE